MLNPFAHMFTICFTDDDDGRFCAIVHDPSGPDPKIRETLRETGGSWSNRVRWSVTRKSYVVFGRFSFDPNYGDDPISLEQRLRRAGFPLGHFEYREVQPATPSAA